MLNVFFLVQITLNHYQINFNVLKIFSYLFDICAILLPYTNLKLTILSVLRQYLFAIFHGTLTLVHPESQRSATNRRTCRQAHPSLFAAGPVKQRNSRFRRWVNGGKKAGNRISTFCREV